MFDIGASELLLIIIAAVIVIGPKDMPLAMRTAGRWIGKIRRVSRHFRSGIETMIREAEMEELEKQWREQNDAIMAAHPHQQMEPLPGSADDATSAVQPAAGAEARTKSGPNESDQSKSGHDQPQLPLGGASPPP